MGFVTIASAVPNPTVTGPIPSTNQPGNPPGGNYPFAASLVDVTGFGYVEEEYFIERVSGTNSLYKTRLLVHKPVNPKKFNGIVVLEMSHNALNIDDAAAWSQLSDVFMRSGYAYVMVSAQPVGISNLATWNPTRYAGFHIDTVNSSAIDIYDEAAQAIKNPVGVNPLAGLTVKKIIGTGVSQAGTPLTSYYNLKQSTSGLIDGFIFLYTGSNVAINVNVPTFIIVSETDIVRNGPIFRKGDTNIRRLWEMAGASHIGAAERDYLVSVINRDVPGYTLTLGPNTFNINQLFGCTNVNDFPRNNILAAGFNHMIPWMKDGTPPPIAPVIDINASAPYVIRDADGNSLSGGVRLSQIDVPIAKLSGEANTTGCVFGFLLGQRVDFTPTRLNELYSNHGAYVSKVNQVTNQNLSNGFILSPDATATRQDAAQSSVGK